MLFTTFYDQGNEIRGLDAAQTVGTPVTSPSVAWEGAQLPPPQVTRSLVMSYLADPIAGLPTGNEFAVEPYHSSFSLDAIGQPSLGVVAGGPFGTGVAGGVSMIFGDQLSDRQIFAAIQANGTVKDIGGALQYYNMKNRWNYGGGVEHIPYLTGQVYLKDTTLTLAGRRRSLRTRSIRSCSGSTSIRRRCSRSIRSRRRSDSRSRRTSRTTASTPSCSRRRSSATRSSIRATRS